MPTLQEIINDSKKAVFLGGAGVSTESGIPDFRSAKGLWNQETHRAASPEEMVSHSYFFRHPDHFYEFYFQHLIFPDVKPNTTHHVLAHMEKKGFLQAIVTQNIDGLHQAAGSKTVYELHGSVYRYFCLDCKASYDLPYVLDISHRRPDSPVPICEKCGGMLKPDVVLFEEPLDQDTMSGAVQAIRSADTLIVGGTSLVVYPAAGLLNYFRGKHLVLINRDPTPYDHAAELVLHRSLGEVFGELSL